METTHVILIILLVLFIISIAGHIVILHSQPVQTTSTSSTVVVKKPGVQPIGGCSGTRYGCCPNGVTPKVDYVGSNCY